ncbi:MAG TPA: hypothetical protein VHO29_05875 [Marmoricola sp.]|nr:hypothetical protein [Marmoricola sp.]
MVIGRLGLLLVPLLLLSACSGTTQDVPAADKQIQAYFDDIATQTVDSLRSAIRLAAPGSPAATYATYLEGSTQAAAEGGQTIDPTKQTAERTDSGYRFCQGSATKQVCYEYTAVTRRDGLVADFAINGKPVASRLAAGDMASHPFRGLAAKAVFESAYEATASGKLLVVVWIGTDSGPPLSGVQASYRSPGAASASASTMTLGRPELGPGSSGKYLFAFDGATIGGTITVTATRNGRQSTVTLQAGPRVAS